MVQLSRLLTLLGWYARQDPSRADIWMLLRARVSPPSTMFALAVRAAFTFNQLISVFCRATAASRQVWPKVAM
jgi:hypothetical protein